MFTPNMDLYKVWDESEKVGRMPYIAVFRKNGKTLIYMADNHGANVSFDMIDFCFGPDAPAIPQIAVLEFPPERQPTLWSFHDNSLIYAGGIAAMQGIPVVYADLTDQQIIDVLEKHNPGKSFHSDDLRAIRRAGGPSYKKGELNRLAAHMDMYGRDPFMLNNIVAALNKYDVVFATFGEGHYRSQRLVLEDMMGKPEYIKDVPNTRADFTGLEIKPIKLIQD